MCKTNPANEIGSNPDATNKSNDVYSFRRCCAFWLLDFHLFPFSVICVNCFASDLNQKTVSFSYFFENGNCKSNYYMDRKKTDGVNLLP